MNMLIPFDCSATITSGMKMPGSATNAPGPVPPRPVMEVRMSHAHCIECGTPCDWSSKRCWPCHLERRQKNNAPLTPPNPSGLCMCGCGQKTNIADKNDPRPRSLSVKGTPLRYVSGHHKRPGLIEYTVDEETGCWNWIGHRKSSGHAGKHWNGRRLTAHTYMWEKHHGPVPEGLELDHLCRNPGCVNPEHLEPVTHIENVRRGRAAKLTVDHVREIRAKAATQAKAELGRMYGVSTQTIYSIVNRQSWRGVE